MAYIDREYGIEFCNARVSYNLMKGSLLVFYPREFSQSWKVNSLLAHLNCLRFLRQIAGRLFDAQLSHTGKPNIHWLVQRRIWRLKKSDPRVSFKRSTLKQETKMA